MGHMNALDRLKRQSKRQRDDEALIDEVVDRMARLYSKALAKANYEVNGHHNIRTGRLLQRTFDVVGEYIERYGADCAEAALDKHLSDLGINVVVRDSKR